MLYATLLSLSLTVFSRATLDDLGFMTGSWRAQVGEMTVDEVWLEPRGNNMSGMFRMAGEERTDLLELMSIEQTETELVFRLRHFNSALVPWASEIDGPLVATAVVPEPGVVIFTPRDADSGVESIAYRDTGETLTATVTFPAESSQSPFVMVFARAE